MQSAIYYPVSKNVSLWFCYHHMHDWFDCAFSWDSGFRLYFWDKKWTIGYIQPKQGLQLKVRRDRPTLLWSKPATRACTQIEPRWLTRKSNIWCWCHIYTYDMMVGGAIGGGGMINSAPDIIRDTARATPGGHLDSPGCWVRLNIVTPSHRWDLY